MGFRFFKRVPKKACLQDVRHNSGKIYRKVGRIDCGKSFFKHTLVSKYSVT